MNSHFPKKAVESFYLIILSTTKSGPLDNSRKVRVDQIALTKAQIAGMNRNPLMKPTIVITAKNKQEKMAPNKPAQSIHKENLYQHYLQIFFYELKHQCLLNFKFISF